ncbi:MAG: NPCBM/NEW2 domain-containing protein [Verrucomicrobiota bacterium]|nr:NPCBM/NEW2 domain-containing protein [Verrucomicrobiota bacterium]
MAKKASPTTKATPIINGTDWRDTEGRPIKAHGGGILHHKGIYYWYGEEHSRGFGNKTGVSCYRSRDLLNWEFACLALPKEALPDCFGDEGVCERPKVLFCEKTGKFVMWMHLDANHYTERSAGVATCDTPDGLFVLEHIIRPISYDYGAHDKDSGGGQVQTEEQLKIIAMIDEAGRGNALADMNLFLDDDGTAYIFYSSENNSTLYVSKLSSDFTDIARPVKEGKTWARTHIKRWREAPAPFKYNGRYYLFSSGCTGWNPNPLLLSVADSPLGPWKELGNPCTGHDAATSFRSQPTYVLPAPHGPKNAFIYLGDRWDAHDIRRATYVWLPFFVGKDGAIALSYYPQWDFSVFEKKPKTLATPQVTLTPGKADAADSLSWEPVPGADCYRVYQNNDYYASVTETTFTLPEIMPGKALAWVVVAATLAGNTSAPSTPLMDASMPVPSAVWLSDYEPDASMQSFGTLGRDRNVMNGPLSINGKGFEKGLGTHAHSEVLYRIGGNFSEFHATIGLDDSHRGGTVEFQVWGDGHLIYTSGVMSSGAKVKKVRAKINGVFELKLVVTDAGDGTHNDHANWADAALHP